MTEAQIKHMVARFLVWKLPSSFSPDCGINIEPLPSGVHPVGMNVFTAVEAEAMVRYMLAAEPPPRDPGFYLVRFFPQCRPYGDDAWPWLNGGDHRQLALYHPEGAGETPWVCLNRFYNEAVFEAISERLPEFGDR